MCFIASPSLSTAGDSKVSYNPGAGAQCEGENWSAEISTFDVATTHMYYRWVCAVLQVLAAAVLDLAVGPSSCASSLVILHRTAATCSTPAGLSSSSLCSCVWCAVFAVCGVLCALLYAMHRQMERSASFGWKQPDFDTYIQ